jgi:hypothetical protein
LISLAYLVIARQAVAALACATAGLFETASIRRRVGLAGCSNRVMLFMVKTILLCTHWWMLGTALLFGLVLTLVDFQRVVDDFFLFDLIGAGQWKKRRLRRGAAAMG